ncbi:PAS domain S-box protein [Permianibacter aggregans]|uniref:histidine kinase n=1 Tax=Permianibacter aggregans TaxID=1510150 RepID=A0A4V3D756_9GAMM|nr:PAS domain S-box protein [Permianibacter aggregans]QGX40681.1 PAS domain S-box protein [Permianibacter aggregans]TDQ46557.1 PAS domain S-box-containing protein [Permianibacter aggregans]
MNDKSDYQSAPLPDDENERLLTLQQLHVLDSSEEAVFDQITAQAATIFQVPICLVSLVDHERQWFKSRQGLDVCETSRELAFCAHAILQDGIFEVRDTLQDPRFRGSPLVQGAPHIRFYAGAPLITDNQHRIGTLCLIDRVPRQLNSEQRQLLSTLAALVVQRLQQRKHQLELKLAQKQQAPTDTPATYFQLLRDSNQCWRFTFIAPEVDRLLDLKQEDLTENFSRLLRDFSEADRNGFLQQLNISADEQTPLHAELHWPATADQTERWLAINAEPDRTPDGGVTLFGQLTDISRVKRDQHIQDGERRRLQMIVEGTRTGIWEWTVGEQQVYINEHFATLLGTSIEALAPFSSEAWESLVHPEDLPNIQRQLESHLQGDIPALDLEYRMRHALGYWVWVHGRGRVYTRSTDQQKLVAGTLQDISGRKLIEQEIRRARQYLQTVVDASTDVAIFTTNARGQINLFNPGAEKLLGYRASEVIGQIAPEQFFDTQELEQRRQQLALPHRQTINHFDLLVADARLGHTDTRQWTWYDKQRQPHQVRLSISALETAENVVSGFVGIAVDLTDRILAEEQWKQSQQRFSGAFDMAPIGMALVSLQGKWLEVNNHLCKLLGYPREELLRTDFQTVTHPEDLQADLQYVQALLNGKLNHYQMEKRYFHKSGEIIWGLLSVSLVRDSLERPVHFVSLIQDITEQKRTEQIKDQFIATVSHELRTPLTSIVGALGLINGGVLGDLSDEMADMLRIAEQNSKRLMALVNDLLDMEKLGAGKLELKLKPLQLDREIDSVLESLQAYAHQYRIRMQFSESARDHAQRCVVLAESRRLQQVLTNYLSNAIKFSPPGSEVRIEISQDHRHAQVTVSDNGPGIPVHLHDRLFQKFGLLDGSSTRTQPGTGLGLAICKELVEAMHGEVGFDSMPGNGCRFWFSLPLVSAELHYS